MTHLQTNKKILVYIFLFILLGTFNNKNFSRSNVFEIKEIKVSGLDEKDNKRLLDKFQFLRMHNLIFLDKKIIEKIINSNNLIEKYFVFKKYPSLIDIKIKKTEFLAYIGRDGKYFFIGSNGKLINAIDKTNKIPFIFGNPNIKEFLKFKRIIDNSKFKYAQIKDIFFFPSKRWDIKTHSGILIKLSKDKLKESLDLSFNIISNSQFENLKKIDLRQNNQVIIDGK